MGHFDRIRRFDGLSDWMVSLSKHLDFLGLGMGKSLPYDANKILRKKWFYLIH